jgi:glycosyltransferase involved in cell wall biosynthesis
MRVTHVITRLIVGGAQENTIASVLGLQQKPGLDVRLISGGDTGPEGSLAHEFNSSPSTLTVLPELVRPIHPWKDVLAWRQLTRMFREQRPDIVHTHSGKAGVLGRLAAHRAGVPVIIHTIHGPSFGLFQPTLSNLIFLAAERHVGKITTHFVAVADAMIRQYLAAGIGRPGQYSKILSGFSSPPFLSATNDPRLRAKFGLKPENIVIGKIARLFKLKGHDDLFSVAPELVRKYPQIRFLLVGDGPWRERFEQRARTLRLDSHFIFTGLVPPAQVPALIGIMDILAHLSLREGLPRALPQALAAAKPIVAYDCDGAAEVCLENETGFLIRPGNLGALRERLGQLVADGALRERLGRRGREFVRERFAVEKMVDDLFALYLKLSPGSRMTPT